MLQLAIVIIALAGMAYEVDPLWRPYLDVAMWVAGAMVMFALGNRLQKWTDHLAAKSHWRRSTEHRYSGASILLLDK